MIITKHFFCNLVARHIQKKWRNDMQDSRIYHIPQTIDQRNTCSGIYLKSLLKNKMLVKLTDSHDFILQKLDVTVVKIHKKTDEIIY